VESWLGKMYFFSGLGTVFSFRLVARRADSGLQGKRFRPSSAYIAKKTGNCSEGKKFSQMLRMYRVLRP